MVFLIFKSGRPTGAKKFSTYEAARQHVRKNIRKTARREVDLFWTSNPMIGDYGYEIRRFSHP
jgi:hypothetical protein